MITSTKFARYAYDNTPYVMTHLLDVIKTLETDSTNTLLQWFSESNYIAKICNLVCHRINAILLLVEKIITPKSSDTIAACEKLLRIEINSRLNFKEHSDDYKTSRKVNALSRIISDIDKSKKLSLIKSFVVTYCIYWILLYLLDLCVYFAIKNSS